MTVERVGMTGYSGERGYQQVVRPGDVRLHALVHVRLDDFAGRPDGALDRVAVRGAVGLQDVAPKAKQRCAAVLLGVDPVLEGREGPLGEEGPGPAHRVGAQ